MLEGHLDADPVARIARPRLPARLPRPIAEAEYALALVLAADPILRAELLLAGMAGLRCCELARLRWSDVDLPGRTVRVSGKGDRDRIVPLHREVAEHLADMPRTAPFVCSARQTARSASAISQQVNAFLHGVAASSASAHQLRHRCATRVYRASRDLPRHNAYSVTPPSPLRRYTPSSR